MRLKIKKLLSGGEYFVSFENLDFNQEETEKIEKFGMPTVDFSSNGMGPQSLNEIDISVKCQNATEAEQMVGDIRQRIKDSLTELLAQVDNFTGEEVVEL